MNEDRNNAIKMIKDKLNGKSSLSYVDIAELTNYHPKYILKLKKDILNNNINYIHGNKNKKPVNTIPLEEEQKIVSLYKRSNASIRKFCKFYGRRSYSCVYNVLKRNGLLEDKNNIN